MSDVAVLELGHIVAGPFCAMLLADLGAEVIKVEHPEGGDSLRTSSPEGKGMFNYVNRNKKSLTLDLKSDDGKAIFEELVDDADVIIENYSKGTAAALGVDYQALVERNPALVYCSIKGFGEGPYEARPALDPVAEAISGLMSTTGYPGNPPTRCGTSIADMITSFQGALAVVGALRQRDHNGDGQHITAPLFESTIGVMGGHIAFSETSGEAVQPMGGGGQSQWAPYDVFKTGDDRWVFIGPTSEEHWQVLCEALELELQNDERFDTLAKRRENRDELKDALSEEFQQYKRDELLALLSDEMVPAAPVNNTREVTDDAHLRKVGALVEIHTAEGEESTIRVPQSPIRSTGFNRRETTDPPRLGEDTDDVLGAIGYTTEQIEQLKRDGTI